MLFSVFSFHFKLFSCKVRFPQDLEGIVNNLLCPVCLMTNLMPVRCHPVQVTAFPVYPVVLLFQHNLTVDHHVRLL